MAITLNNVESGFGAKKTKRRNGRGLARKGTTGGRGQKGQKSRTGVGGLKRLGMRKLILSTPKLRGFRSLNGKAEVVNLDDISRAYIAGEVVSPRTLVKKGIIASQRNRVKVLGTGEISVSVKVKGCEVSKLAADKIGVAGGKVE